MALVVWKFPLASKVEQTLSLPKGARIQHFGLQQSIPTLWVLCDPQQPIEPVEFILVETGTEFDPKPEDKNTYVWSPVGTVLMHNDAFVLHLIRVEKAVPLNYILADLKKEKA